MGGESESPPGCPRPSRPGLSSALHIPLRAQEVLGNSDRLRCLFLLQFHAFQALLLQNKDCLLYFLSPTPATKHGAHGDMWLSGVRMEGSLSEINVPRKTVFPAQRRRDGAVVAEFRNVRHGWGDVTAEGLQEWWCLGRPGSRTEKPRQQRKTGCHLGWGSGRMTSAVAAPRGTRPMPVKVRRWDPGLGAGAVGSGLLHVYRRQVHRIPAPLSPSSLPPFLPVRLLFTLNFFFLFSLQNPPQIRVLAGGSRCRAPPHCCHQRSAVCSPAPHHTQRDQPRPLHQHRSPGNPAVTEQRGTKTY